MQQARNLLEQHKSWLPGLSIVCLAVVVHMAAMPGDFFMDDLIIVRDNPQILSPSLKEIFLTDYWGPSENSGLYRPLTILSFVMNRWLLGHAAWGYHLINILLHAGVSFLFFCFLRRMGVPQLAGWFAAALFAVHPIHGEPVNELVGRSELLVAAFLLGGLFLARGVSRWQTPAVCLCFAGALLSKEHGIVFLALLPMVDLFCEQSGSAVLRRRMILYPLLLVIAGFWLYFRNAGIERPFLEIQKVYDPFYVPLSSLEWPARVLAALKVQLLYLGKLLVPLSLQGMYPRTTVMPPAPLWSFWTILIVCALGLLLTGLWSGWRRRELWGLAIAGYIICFSPTSNLLILTEVTMADRLAYLPSLWFCLGVAVAVLKCPEMDGLKTRTMVIGSLLAIFLLLGWSRSLDFRSPEALWRHDLTINPQNELSSLMLGDELWRQGRVQEAEAEYRRLVTLAPEFNEGLRTYASLLLSQGQPEVAIGYARRAVATGVGRFTAAYMPLADAYIDTGRLDLAYQALEKGRGTHEYRAIYWEILGKFYEAKGDRLAAVQAYGRALKAFGPWSDDTFRRLARVYLELGYHDKAEAVLRRDVKRHESAEGYNSLGIALALQGKTREARQAFARAVELQPENKSYQENLERLGH